MTDETVQVSDLTAEESAAEQVTVEAESSRDGERMVPVGEAIRYRKRAQAAEASLTEMQGELEALRGELSETRTCLADVERRARIDALLLEADVIDLEAARFLTEITVAGDEVSDLEETVKTMKRRKPYLFARKRRGGGAMSPRVGGGEGSEREALAEMAAESGDRQTLLRYLRARRR